MKNLETCHHCGEEKVNCFHGYIAMCLPIPEAEAQIEKWNLIDAYKNYVNTPFNLGGPKGKDNVADYEVVRGITSYVDLTQEDFNNKIKIDSEFSKQWFTNKWFNNLERTDLTPEEVKELDDLCSYDQMLNTVGRGVQCNDCGKKEAELYEKYYPENLES